MTRNSPGNRHTFAEVLFLAALAALAACAATATSNELGTLGQAAPASLLIGFGVAFFAARLLTIRFPQGDEAYVVLVVGATALGVLDLRSALLVALVAGMLDSVGRFSQLSLSAVVTRALDALRSTAVLGLLAPWQLLLRPMITQSQAGDAILLVVFGLGLTYAALDALTFAIQHRLTGGPPVMQNAVALMRSLASVYLVHISMSAVALRAYPALGLWGFAIALLLTLILQNSVSLYMRIRRAYNETIEALAHASELDSPHDIGHSRRVADMSVAVARHMGLTGNALGRVRYAALLHDIGRIGQASDESLPEHSRRGAEIVASVPFLVDVAPLIEHQHEDHPGPEMIGAAVVGVCSRYDRLRERAGATAALDAMRTEESGLRRNVVAALEDVLKSWHPGASA